MVEAGGWWGAAGPARAAAGHSVGRSGAGAGRARTRARLRQLPQKTLVLTVDAPHLVVPEAEVAALPTTGMVAL